jgi:hypothetical protein
MDDNLVASIKSFFIGGTLIGGAKYISDRVGPVWASLFAGIPTGIISALFLKDQGEMRQFYEGYFTQSVVLVFVVSILNGVITFTGMDTNTSLQKKRLNLLLFFAIALWLSASIYWIHKIKKNKTI